MNSNSSPNALPVLYLDLDGVVNFTGSRTQYAKHSGFGHMRRGSVLDPSKPSYDAFTRRNNLLNLNWSAELLRKLAQLPVELVILSTWRHDFDTFKRVTQWDDLTEYRVLDWTDGPRGSEHAGKVPALVADQLADPRPFIWVDDEAHAFYSDADRDALSSVPNLLVTTDEKFGITLADYTAMLSFLASLSGSPVEGR